MIQIVLHRQRNGTTRPINKENMPLEHGIMPTKPDETLIQKATWVSQSFATLVRGKWISEALEEVMEAIEQGTCFLQGASWIFHIPRSSFSNHLNGCT
jgi:hypothetical protein